MSENLENTEGASLTSISIRAIDTSKEDDESSPEYSPNGRYRKLNILLGSGTFKNVYKAIDEEEGKEVAWNSLLIKDYETAQEERVTYLEEIQLLKSISHPNIIELYDFWFTDNNFVFITELMTSGTLRDYIRNVKDMNIKIIRKWSKQILEGIFYLHNLNPMIIHRDIKCENIFVNGATGIVKIGDLGIAKKKDIKRYTMVGTPEFMAKEIFEGDGYSEKVDVYAFGMCLLEMATGKSPYSELKSTAQVFRNVIKGILPEGIKHIKDGCLKSLILSCISPESSRPSVKECLSHHFFQQEEVCDGRCFKEDDIPSVALKDIDITMKYGPSNIIRCQVYFNADSRYVTFKYNADFDTPDTVAQEMADQGLIEREKKRTIADLIEKSLKSLSGTCLSSTAPVASSANVGDSTSTKNETQCSRKTVEKTAETAPSDAVSTCTSDVPSSENLSAQIKNQVFIQETSTNSCQNCASITHSSTEAADRSSPAKESDAAQCSKDQARMADSIDFPKTNFPDTMSIEELALETAFVTKRDEETVKEWIEIFKMADIDTVGELRTLTEEDWNALPLTVFGARAVKNMLFGKCSQPPPEKDLMPNKNIKEYGDDVTIQELLDKILTSKKEAIKSCENKLRTQDIRTVSELRSLHEDDWNKLGLSVLTNRVLKNSMKRRGKSLYCGSVVH